MRVYLRYSKYFLLLVVVCVDLFLYQYIAVEEGDYLGNTGEVMRQVAYISGEVSIPGVYALSPDMRVFELLEQAGGLTDNVDRNYVVESLNLAKVVVDEEHVFIPANQTSKQNNVDGNLVNLNTASKEVLMTLPGIGESTAEKIITNRPFAVVEDLLMVDGIGENKLAQVLPLVGI